MNWVGRNQSDNTQAQSLSFLYSDFETHSQFHLKRKREIEELLILFQERIEAESIYSQRLLRIAEHKNQCITIGKLSEEVQSYKQNCMSKARQAQELADNMDQDCVKSIKDILKRQDEEFAQQKMQGRILISNLHDVDLNLKQSATSYFRAAKEAEEIVIKYEQVKYAVDMTMAQKQLCHESMIQTLKKVRERESEYKESVDNSNTYLADFRKQIEELIKQQDDFEKERCEAIHAAINKFVVYEKFSEMNNKYDVNNFSKLLEEYNNESELEAIKAHIAKLQNVNIPRYEFVGFESKYFNINNIKSEDLAPPREKLSHYTNSNDVLKFLIGRILTEVPLHEEYYLQLDNMFQNQEGRDLLIQHFNKRFNTQNKFYMGKASFKNLKEQLDQFLHQCYKNKDYTNAINIFPFLETFHLRGMSENGEQNPSIKSFIRYHLIWNNFQLWDQILTNKLKDQNIQSTQSSSEQQVSEQQPELQKNQDKENSNEEQKGQQSQDQSEIDSQKIKLLTILKDILSQMSSFVVPVKVMLDIRDSFCSNFSIPTIGLEDSSSKLSQKLKEIKELIQESEKKEKELMEKEMENKKKNSQASKGVPEWIQDLFDPPERPTSRQNKPKPFLSFKELIGGQKRPSSPNQQRPNPSNWSQPKSKILTDSHETEETTAENN